jgi:hypothetical protein
LLHLLTGLLPLGGGDDAVAIKIHAIEALKRPLAELGLGDYAVGAEHTLASRTMMAGMLATLTALGCAFGTLGCPSSISLAAALSTALPHLRAHLLMRLLGFLARDLAIAIEIKALEHLVGALERLLTGDVAATVAALVSSLALRDGGPGNGKRGKRRDDADVLHNIYPLKNRSGPLPPFSCLGRRCRQTLSADGENCRELYRSSCEQKIIREV